jgi:hypothetical protein
MTDTTFEIELTRLLRVYAQHAVRPIDRFAIAETTIAAGRASIGSRLSFGLRRRPLVLVLVGLIALALAASAVLVGARLLNHPRFPARDGYVDEFVRAPALPTAMSYPVLRTLTDGRVLVIDGDSADASAGLYDPSTGAFATVGPMVSADRAAGATIRLLDGRVLIAGRGITQIFDPSTSGFVAVPPMVIPRTDARMVLLRDGRVLITGGTPPRTGYLDTVMQAEVFDPESMTFTTTGTMSTTADVTATLPDGRVFVTSLGTAEVYDPTTGSFSPAGTIPDGLSGCCEPVAAIAAADGRVIVVGSTAMQTRGYVAIWDPATATFTSARRIFGAIYDAVLLADGRILLIGGRPTSRAAVHDPSTGATTEIPAPTAYRPKSAPLPDGRVLFVGGRVDGDLRPDPVGSVGLEAPAVPTVEIFQ